MLRYSCLPPGVLLDAPGVLPPASGSILPQAEGASHAGRASPTRASRRSDREGKDELEFEIRFAYDGDSPGLDKFHVHIRCFAAWEFERSKPV
jgi:hypothetical protein